ncbi:MAG: hypothetical protein IJ228_04995 [Succinivibrio sp.]|nr:hypothetical protein [Succinivibrio sp.]
MSESIETSSVEAAAGPGEARLSDELSEGCVDYALTLYQGVAEELLSVEEPETYEKLRALHEDEHYSMYTALQALTEDTLSEENAEDLGEGPVLAVSVVFKCADRSRPEVVAARVLLTVAGMEEGLGSISWFPYGEPGNDQPPA